MQILVVGSGGREHALCEKIKESPLVSQVYVAPGNPGISDAAELLPYSEKAHDELVKFSQTQKIDLVLIGPEQPLVDGLADRFQKVGVKVFAPSRKAAEIEGSKAFAKDLMKRYGIPTADYRVFAEYPEARDYLEQCSTPIVIKADGLAAGKGVVVAQNREEASLALKEMLVGRKFGSASAKVVIEEYLEGEEFSLMALVHGDQVIPLEIAQDHKRAYDGDRGPNTGGMGAYSPVPQIGPHLVEESVETIIKPTVQALLEEGRFYSGILYGGLILTEEGPKVIEFNARFGDPETQVVLPRLKSDLVEVILRLMSGERCELCWSPQAMLGVVVAGEGYPERGVPGAVLPDLPQCGEGLRVFYSGVALNDDGRHVSTGGRAFLLGALEDTLAAAQSRVYGILDDLDLPGLFYRRDIGHKAQ